MKNLKGPMAFITVSMFLNFLGFTIIIPVIPFLIGKYVSADHIGLYVGIITSVYALCQFFAAPALGALSDKYGRRPILLLSLFGSVVGYIVFGLGGALWILFLGRIIDGLTGGNISTMFAYVADIAEPKDRGQLYGILGAAGGFGFMFGPALGGLFAKFSLGAPLFLAAGVTLINMAWGYFALPESLPKELRAKKFEWNHLSPFTAFSHVFTSTILQILFTASFLFFIAGTAMQATISVFLKDVLSFGPTGIGLVLFAVGVMDIITQGFLTGKLLPKFGEKRLAIAGLSINALGFLAIAAVAFFPSVIFIYIAIIIFNLGDGLFQPAINGLISNSVDNTVQGRIQGANQGMQSIARVIGPLIGAALYIYGRSLPYFAGALIIVGGLLTLVFFRNKIQPITH
jgi:DHA1 family tetracycline resistance protein-like MFS transporter